MEKSLSPDRSVPMIRPAQTFARILLLAMMASALVAPGCTRSSKAVTLTASNFEENVLNSKKPVLVDFWADWCGPCKMMDPVIRELAAEFEGKAVVGKINADDYPEILNKYGIQGLPTF